MLVAPVMSAAMQFHYFFVVVTIRDLLNLKTEHKVI